ncbi:MAG: hypothetical protein J7604_03635 [Sporocytophaga sp.]|uniref:GumC family protein n=1 Tax=Sporocytophaga sp. TaxID=2231183 RepID=UPI001B21FFBC|nr:GNVR domain-containing protein [Sporocytophaga sp.]MBO9699273.1 hypothetical protein [Sporocytophaga sp.]
MKPNIHQEEFISIRSVLNKLIKNKKYYLLSIGICITLATILILYISPQYAVNSSILLRLDSKNTPNIETYLSGTDLFKRDKNLENELGIITSYNLIYKTIDELNFRVSYYQSDLIRINEIYKKSPFEVIVDTSHNQIVNFEFTLTPLGNNKIRIQTDGSDLNMYNAQNKKVIKEYISEFSLDDTLTYGDEIKNEYISFKIIKSIYNYDFSEAIIFKINDLNKMTEDYRKNLSIQPLSKESTILKLYQISSTPDKTIDFQNKLLNNYLNNDLNEKRQIAVNTIAYIDTQLEGISDSLNLAEGDLERYRSANTVVDLSYEGKSLFDKFKELETEKSKEIFKEKYYEYLLNYLIKNTDINSMTAPSTIGIMDPLLNTLVSELTSLNNEKAALSYSTRADNPTIAITNLKIENIKKALTENLINIKNSSRISLDNVNKRMAELQYRMQKLPSKERALLNIQRRFALNDQTYNFLLQKRTEASIAQLSNIMENKVIDYPKTNTEGPVFPNNKLLFAVAIILGFIIPTIVILSRSLLTRKIKTRNELMKHTNIPVIGTIENFRYKSPKEAININDFFTDQFRNLRLKIKNDYGQNLLILVSTPQSNQYNLPTTMAIAGINNAASKKTLMIDGNFNQPTLSNLFSVKSERGLSNFLNCSSDGNDIIETTSFTYLDLIAPGIALNNIPELAEQSELKSYFNMLKIRYDLIIIEIDGVNKNPIYNILKKYADVILINVTSDLSIDELGEIVESIDKSEENKTGIVFYTS